MGASLAFNRDSWRYARPTPCFTPVPTALRPGLALSRCPVTVQWRPAFSRTGPFLYD